MIATFLLLEPKILKFDSIFVVSPKLCDRSVFTFLPQYERIFAKPVRQEVIFQTTARINNTNKVMFLSEIWHKIFLSVKMALIRSGYNFGSEKKFFIVKVILVSITRNSKGKFWNAINCSGVTRQTSRTANFLKGCLFNGLMPVIMCTKFQFDQLISALFFEL